MNPITRAHLRAQASTPDAHAISVAPGDLLELLNATEWHPIETAPRDGTRVLVYSAARKDAAAFQGITAWSPDNGWWSDDLTHWMPLPSPPAKGGNDARE